MRLIDTTTGEFVNFQDLEEIPPYAILSHTWDEKGEQSYQEVVEIQAKYRHRSRLDSFGHALNSLASWLLLTPAQSIMPVSHRYLHSCSIFFGFLPLWWLALTAVIDFIVQAWLSLSCRSIFDPSSELSDKVRRACKIARQDGYGYIWIDSSCIDETSSSELSEAINSMFNWYRAAQVCYAFLADVPSDEDVLSAEGSKFRMSRWFTRGWTLQELIAPHWVIFLSQDWDILGTKHGLADVIQEITFIDPDILTHKKDLSDESVADRMRWASKRKTTRVEDAAYSLLGIFGITMTTLYGEGQYAFRRLQEEILRRIPDQSIFAWGRKYVSLPLKSSLIQVGIQFREPSCFAESPADFASLSHGRTIQPTWDSIKFLELPVEEYTPTPYGIRTQLCFLPLQALSPDLRLSISSVEPSARKVPSWHLMVLRSQDATYPQRLLSRLCYLHSNKANVEFLHLPNQLAVRLQGEDSSDVIPAKRHAIIFTLPLDDLEHVWKNQLLIKTVYLPHPRPSIATRQLKIEDNTLSLTLGLPMWARAALQMHGYTISNVQCSAEYDRSSLSFTLLHASFNIHIHCRSTLEITSGPFSERLMIMARVWIISPGDEAPNTSASIPCSPPYITATWTSSAPFPDMTLQAHSLNLVADAGDEVTLWLGLDLTALSQPRYNVLVEVIPTQAKIEDIDSSDCCPYPHQFLQFSDPHSTTVLNLILPGSVRRSLKKRGYSASQFDFSPSLDGFHTHFLTLSSNNDSSFAVIVKYLRGLRGNGPLRAWRVELAVITLESISYNSATGSQKVQDGPHVVTWGGFLKAKHVILTTPTGELLTLHLGFELLWQSECYLHIDIEPGTSRQFQPHLEYHYLPVGQLLTLDRAHQSISLTLPGHIKRALQLQGYQALFEGLDGGGDSVESAIRHRLTLTHNHASAMIIIEYSHHLVTRYPEPDLDSDSSTWQFKRRFPFVLADPPPDSGLPTPAVTKASLKRCQQELTFQALVYVFPSRNIPGGAPRRIAVRDSIETTTVEWDAKGGPELHQRELRFWEQDGWCLELPWKDITVTMPTGHQLLLRLGFYLAWPSEYCMTVEINPRIPLPRTDSRTDEPAMPDYEEDEAGVEYIRQALVQRTELEQSVKVHNEHPLANPALVESSTARSQGHWKTFWRKGSGLGFGRRGVSASGSGVKTSK
ncbi:hypothetical protein GSI_13201 [Ganoderma sinense ZZ0214-1]|uniref:Uncharacterized protein n=1 Tax=Ganoderma sinense ZZ0214-1 TaxID=1077348 RepID=A0A2G8RUX0_9APHY|nr:hypothetical protein GSI_13201 [Ganoderma sinense ZZ0214-1]